MDNLNKPNLDATKHLDARITDAATDLLNEGKKYASDVYQQGVDKIGNAEEAVKEYSDKLVDIIHEKPITSIIVAAGIGILLASLLKK